MASKKLTFETALQNLEEVTKALQAGDVPLEEAIKNYKKGLEMAEFCHTALEKVEGELKILNADGSLSDFELGE